MQAQGQIINRAFFVVKSHDFLKVFFDSNVDYQFPLKFTLEDLSQNHMRVSHTNYIDSKIEFHIDEHANT